MPINNSLDALDPLLRQVHEATEAKWKAAHPGGPFIGVNETTRSEAVQTAYYSRGRQPVAEILRLYRLAGVPVSQAEAASKTPISNAKYGQSPHNFLPARGYDIRPTDAKGNYLQGAAFDKACADWWQLYKTEAARLKVEVVWGGTWGDAPHIERKYWRTMK